MVFHFSQYIFSSFQMFLQDHLFVHLHILSSLFLFDFLDKIVLLPKMNYLHHFVSLSILLRIITDSGNKCLFKFFFIFFWFYFLLFFSFSFFFLLHLHLLLLPLYFLLLYFLLLYFLHPFFLLLPFFLFLPLLDLALLLF